jgi:hypothetical protein
MSKHTKGPWTLLPAESDKDYLRIRGTQLGGRYKVANVHQWRYEGMPDSIRQHDDAESMANARLIAAAPEMLEALKSALWRMQQYDYQAMEGTIAKARAAIAKATGETP